MNTINCLAALLLCLASTALADDTRSVTEELVLSAQQECESFENGEFDVTNQAIRYEDLTGDGQPEEIVDASEFSCSSSASMWGGSGGTYLWVVSGEKQYEFLAHLWKVIEIGGQKVLVLAVHSSECSDTVGPCYRALIWNDGEFRTTR
ncbi:hypothetical protein [Umboniibacter marinipuniceus]|uniref:Uncharacterized protein n=1 Tax=Umboniibacter marinipuniceus TaxID=569599 RepID=A0A3M0AAH5_9GAMM|nr:hypothetical protein [Umboniibacter marinipuniceus]RMA81214.1 hypothetical protein DFR27_1019 [Umboniibacter marinipuniceus]